MLASADIEGGLRGRLYSSWLAVAAPAVRLCFGIRRRRLMAVLSALAGLSFGAGVTLAVAGPGPPGALAPVQAGAVRSATANRAQAATWIAEQLSAGLVVSCDPQMCAEVRRRGFPAAHLMSLPPSAAGPLRSAVVIATPAVRKEFGAPLAAVDAPLVIASFGAGASRVEVRAVAPDGAAAFEARLASRHTRLIAAGAQLLRNTNITASRAARTALLAGQVDPRLLVTLSALAAAMPLRLAAFDDPSPGASPAVPLRGAEIGSAAPPGLAAMLAFLRAQQPPYRPAAAAIARSSRGQSLVVVRFAAGALVEVGGF